MTEKVVHFLRWRLDSLQDHKPPDRILSLNAVTVCLICMESARILYGIKKSKGISNGEKVSLKQIAQTEAIRHIKGKRDAFNLKEVRSKSDPFYWRLRPAGLKKKFGFESFDSKFLAQKASQA